MARLALIWLTIVVAVNCELFPKENAQEHKVFPVDANEAPSLLRKGGNRLVGVRETPVKNQGSNRGKFPQREEKQKRRQKGGRKTKILRKQTNKKKNVNKRKKTVSLSEFDSTKIDMTELCKTTLLIPTDSEMILVSPVKRRVCKRVIVKPEDDDATLSMYCSRFELADGGCKKEFLSIKGYGRACESEAPEIIEAKSLRMVYKAKSLRLSRGFRCTIRAEAITATTGIGECATCGVADIDPNRIVGGQDTEVNEYPWMLALIVETELGQLFCGASVLTPFWALTAQHCVEGFEADQVSIAYGIHAFEDASNDPIAADTIILHPDFNPVTLDNDVALVKLKTPMPVDGEDLVPICLASSPPEVGDPAVVTGWGALEYGTGDYPDLLQEVEVDIISNEECSDKYADLEGFEITDGMICAARTDKDACNGDSGGPLMIQRPDGRWEQVGIVSFGLDCATPDYPGGYARVDYFFDWIAEYVTECDLEA